MSLINIFRHRPPAPQKKFKKRETASHAHRREAAAFSLLSPANPAYDTWRPRDSSRRELTRKYPKQRSRRPEKEAAKKIRGW